MHVTKEKILVDMIVYNTIITVFMHIYAHSICTYMHKYNNNYVLLCRYILNIHIVIDIDIDI